MEKLLKPLFGSQLVNSTSKTPYSDATQVKRDYFVFFASQLYYFSLPSTSSSASRSALNSERIPFFIRRLPVQHIKIQCELWKKVAQNFRCTAKSVKKKNLESFQVEFSLRFEWKSVLTNYSYKHFWNFFKLVSISFLLLPFALCTRWVWLILYESLERVWTIFTFTIHQHTLAERTPTTPMYDFCVLLWLMNVQMFNILDFFPLNRFLLRYNFHSAYIVWIEKCFSFCVHNSDIKRKSRNVAIFDETFSSSPREKFFSKFMFSNILTWIYVSQLLEFFSLVCCKSLFFFLQCTECTGKHQEGDFSSFKSGSSKKSNRKTWKSFKKWFFFISFNKIDLKNKITTATPWNETTSHKHCRNRG